MLRSGVVGAVFGAALVLAGQAVAGESYNWSGLYVGIHGGAGFGEVDSTNPWPAPTDSCYVNQPNFCTTPTQNPDGWFAGGQIGYNVQSHGLLVGVEADLAFADISEDGVADGNYITQFTEIDALGSARARIGLPIGRFLPYVTGGLAYAHTESGENCPSGAAGGWCKTHGAYSLSESKHSWGWTIGGGLEAAITDNWSIKGEYLYMDLGTETHVLDPNSAANKSLPVASASDRNADWTLHTVRVGLNYKFGEREAPAPLK